MLHPLLEDALDDLLAAWRRHADQRAHVAPIAALAQTRGDLDGARDRVHSLRRALNPEQHEVEESAVAMPCPTLGTVVMLYARDGYRCLCGHAIEADAPA